MTTSFLDWLYNNDSIHGILLLFPLPLKQCNIASLLISEHTDKYNNSTLITDTPLNPPITTYNYSAIDSINKTLTDETVDLVIFDNVRMLAIIAPLLVSLVKPRKLIILTTWGITLRQLNIISDTFPNLYLLTLDIPTVPIQWRTVTVQMSKHQIYYYYDIVRAKEINAPISNHIIPYPITRMLTLYSYPNSMVHKTLSRTCQYIDTELPDIIDNGPKLSSIIQGLVRGVKQIILTQSNQYYGVDLISKFIRDIPCYILSCTDTYEEILQTLTEFNHTTQGVLITSLVPSINLDDVSIIHVTDTYSYPTIQAVLSKLNRLDNIVIYCYVATHPHELSADEVLYKNLQGYIEEVDRIYSCLQSQGAKITYDC